MWVTVPRPGGEIAYTGAASSEHAGSAVGLTPSSAARARWGKPMRERSARQRRPSAAPPNSRSRATLPPLLDCRHERARSRIGSPQCGGDCIARRNTASAIERAGGFRRFSGASAPALARLSLRSRWHANAEREVATSLAFDPSVVVRGSCDVPCPGSNRDSGAGGSGVGRASSDRRGTRPAIGRGDA